MSRGPNKIRGSLETPTGGPLERQRAHPTRLEIPRGVPGSQTTPSHAGIDETIVVGRLAKQEGATGKASESEPDGTHGLAYTERHS